MLYFIRNYYIEKYYKIQIEYFEWAYDHNLLNKSQ